MPEDRTPKDVFDWLNLKEVPDWAKARPLGALVGLLLMVLFGLALAALVGVLFHTIHQAFSPGSDGPNLGAGALIAALLGAPFVIWGTVLKHRTVTFQKEGHITDRINKAVEMLGAEKTVDRIGRAVTIWTGRPRIVTHLVEKDKDWTVPERSIEVNRFWDRTDLDEGQEFIGLHIETKQWPSKRTIIEWQGIPISPNPDEHIDSLGDWQAFSETVPNIEVRIGAILSLERIAQDSTAYDKGRDHVRVMEILCAYVRENSNARKPVDFPEGEWLPLKDGATEEERAAQHERFGSDFPEKKAWKWAQALSPPRADIATALTVLGRRTPEQRKVEAAWPDRKTEATTWPFDTPCPQLPAKPDDELIAAEEISQFKAALDAWTKTLSDYPGYRLDLRGTNLQGADLSLFVLAGAKLNEARMEGADLRETRMQGCSLCKAQLEGANLRKARMEGAILLEARMEGAYLVRARMEGADLSTARMEGAILRKARMAGTNLCGARLDAAFLSGARMEGINLTGARLEEADLSGAEMVGAVLSGARMAKANLIVARMMGANLSGARMEGAHLSEAWLEGADLSRVRMEGADLRRAWMKGANLSKAGMEGANFTEATLEGAAVKFTTATPVAFDSDQIASIFADASVILPEGIASPAHWPEVALDGRAFEKEWRKWQSDPERYRPPPAPEAE